MQRILCWTCQNQSLVVDQLLPEALKITQSFHLALDVTDTEFVDILIFTNYKSEYSNLKTLFSKFTLFWGRAYDFKLLIKPTYVSTS